MKCDSSLAGRCSTSSINVLCQPVGQNSCGLEQNHSLVHGIFLANRKLLVCLIKQSYYFNRQRKLGGPTHTHYNPASHCCFTAAAVTGKWVEAARRSCKESARKPITHPDAILETEIGEFSIWDLASAKFVS